MTRFPIPFPASAAPRGFRYASLSRGAIPKLCAITTLTRVQTSNVPVEFNEANLPVFPETAVPLKVVLVYEDFEMGARGKNVFDLIAKEAGGEGAAQLTVWRFDFFQSADLTQAVTCQTEVADVIIIAPRDPNQLPSQVQSWIEQWPLRRKIKTGALITVFHPEAGDLTKTSDAALLLWRAASRAGMEFFSHRSTSVASRAVTTLSANLTIRTASPTPPAVIFNAFTLPDPKREWGLNE